MHEKNIVCKKYRVIRGTYMIIYTIIQSDHYFIKRKKIMQKLFFCYSSYYFEGGKTREKKTRNMFKLFLCKRLLFSPGL